RLVPRLLLRPVCQLLAVRRKRWPTIRRPVVLGQTLPIRRTTCYRNAAEVVVRAPRLVLLWHSGEDKVLAVRAESVVVARLERRRGRISVAVAGCHVLRLAGLAVVQRHHEEVLPLVLDVGIPVTVEKLFEHLRLDGTLVNLFLSLLVRGVAFLERRL